MEVGARDIRVALGLTQRAVAGISGLTERAVRMFEAGMMHSPRLSTRGKLAAAYRVTLDQVDALARGQAIAWTNPGASDAVTDEQADRLRVAAARAVNEGYVSDVLSPMLDEAEQSDITLRREAPVWLVELADGKTSPEIQRRLGRRDTLTAA